MFLLNSFSNWNKSFEFVSSKNVTFSVRLYWSGFNLNFSVIGLNIVSIALGANKWHDTFKKFSLSVKVISRILTQQHGFVLNKSCESNLIETLDIITEASSRGFTSIIVFLDFAKAFDKVSHQALLIKIKAYGFDGQLCSLSFR